MKPPLVMWWTKTAWAFALFLLVQIGAMWNGEKIDGTLLPTWVTDWSFMLSKWAGRTLLLSPIAAAVTVFVVLRNLGPSVQSALVPLRRGWRPVVDSAGAIVIWGLAAQMVGLGVGAALCLTFNADASGLTLPWQLLTGPAALIAAISVGAAAACMFPSPWTIPGVLIGMFLLHRLFYWHGFPELFTTESATVAMTGWRPKATHLAATVALNAIVVGTVFALHRWLTGAAGGPRRWTVLTIVGLLAYLAVLAPFVLVDDWNTYELLP